MSSCKQALAEYRRRMPKNVQDEVAGFNELSQDDRIELVFWMLLSTNNQMMAISERVKLAHRVTNLADAPKDN